MSNNADDDTVFHKTRAPLTLDRENRKVLGVCGGFARYLDVPSALVRVIYCVACFASPFLIIVYFILYWLLDDEERPARIKAAMGGFSDNSKKTRQSETSEPGPLDPGTASQSPRFDLRKPLYRSRRNVRLAGVCAGIADYLGISTFIVRTVTFLSLFILGGVTLWAYVIFWIVLDKEPKVRKVTSGRAGQKSGEQGQDADDAGEPDSRLDIDTCSDALRTTEKRLQEVEAFITSKQFRLHCEINRI